MCLARRQPGSSGLVEAGSEDWVGRAESTRVQLRSAAKSDLEGLGVDTSAGIECII